MQRGPGDTREEHVIDEYGFNNPESDDLALLNRNNASGSSERGQIDTVIDKKKKSKALVSLAPTQNVDEVGLRE